MVNGRIHSIESMGLVDGPGIRTVIFMQGCKLRCSYCHNPDTWGLDGGTIISDSELIKKLIRFKPYYETSGGGVTFSGGEPLLQPEFLLALLKLSKENKIHTAIDTAGYGFGDYSEILKYTDLVLLDIKNVDDIGYKALTGKSKSGFDEFLEALSKTQARVWIRHVVVPGLTDSKEHIEKLCSIIKCIKNVDKVQLLPYHTLGIEKYKKLNIPYKLQDIAPMDMSKIDELQAFLDRKLDIK